MKKILVLICCLAFLHAGAQGKLNNVLNNVNSDVKDGKNILKDVKGDKKKKDDKQDNSNTNNQTNSQPENTNGNSTTDNTVKSNAPDIKAYSNYDFVPGTRVLFEDNFMDDQDGEFPSHWDLDAGQAIINKVNGENSFFLTEGNYVRVAPRIKVKNYLPDTFTVELDYYIKDFSQYGAMVFFHYMDKEEGYERDASIHFGPSGEVSSSYFPKDFSAPYPGDNSVEKFGNSWHHAAIVYKGGQMKCYLDQYRVLVMPNVGIKPEFIEVGGIGSQDAPIIFKNVRIAAGGGMNMIGKKFTDAKIITHGINFDVNKSTIKPESMGTLNMIVQVMKDNPDLKFEVGGHTDSDGDDASNLKLSQARADAVKGQLVSMGIDASRLTAKGYGETKPIDKNETPEGKANNRRVEFVKM